MAHLIPAIHCFHHGVPLWNTCALLDDPNKQTISWSCVFVIHLMEGTCMIGAIASCIYILHEWSFERLDVFERLLVLTNIITLAMFLFEGSLTWITFIRDSLWYQSYSLFALSFLLCFGVILGVFIQYNVCSIFKYISVIS